MTSNWALPNNIDQYAEDGAESFHVMWEEVDSFSALKNKDKKFVKTKRDLLHIARDPRKDILEKTYFLRLKNFNFENLPDEISGIEVKVTMNRYGRISDDTVQLCLDGQLIGENFATTDLTPIKTYGNATEKWNTFLTKSDLNNPSFGVVMRFKSQPNWPHKNSALIDSVEIRVH